MDSNTIRIHDLNNLNMNILEYSVTGIRILWIPANEIRISMNIGIHYSNINEYEYFFLIFRNKWKTAHKNFRACCTQINNATSFYHRSLPHVSENYSSIHYSTMIKWKTASRRTISFTFITKNDIKWYFNIYFRHCDPKVWKKMHKRIFF